MFFFYRFLFLGAAVPGSRAPSFGVHFILMYVIYIYIYILSCHTTHTTTAERRAEKQFLFYRSYFCVGAAVPGGCAPDHGVL